MLSLNFTKCETIINWCCHLFSQEVDVEAGEKDELLDKEGKENSDSNKKDEGDELEEVKVNNLIFCYFFHKKIFHKWADLIYYYFQMCLFSNY